MADNTKPQDPAVASQNGQSAAMPQQQTQQNARPCPKDCSKCSWNHQIYCTAKMTFDSFTVMSHIIQLIEKQSEKIDAQAEKIAELSGRIVILEGNKTEFSAPQPTKVKVAST